MCQQSTELKDLAAALVKVQAVLRPAPRSADNPFFKSSYTDLAGLWESVRGPLTDNGLSVIQTTDGDGEYVKVVTTLLHVSGQWIRGTCALRPVKNDPQSVGSAVTYGRRYGLSAIVGACSEGEDDDGNSATHSKPAPAQKDLRTQLAEKFEADVHGPQQPIPIMGETPAKRAQRLCKELAAVRKAAPKAVWDSFLSLHGGKHSSDLDDATATRVADEMDKLIAVEAA